MDSRQDDLSEMLLQARAVRARWRAEADLAAIACDDGREVACGYHVSVLDGFIALLTRMLVH